MSAESTQESQKKVNESLITALAKGDVKKFESLLTEGEEINGVKYKADIRALKGDMQTVAGKDNFNLSVPPTKTQSQGVREIVNNIHAGKYTKDTQDINLPALAAYSSDAKLMETLIKEQPVAKRDFNMSLGQRPSHPVSQAITNGSPEVANLLIDNAKDLGIDTSKIRTGVGDHYSVGDMKTTSKYLEKIPKLSQEDLLDISQSMAPTMAQFSTQQSHSEQDKAQFAKVTESLLTQIAESPKGPQLIKSVSEGIKMLQESGIQYDKHHVKMLQKTAGTMSVQADTMSVPAKTNPFAPDIEADKKLISESRATLAEVGGKITQSNAASQESSRASSPDAVSLSSTSSSNSVLSAIKSFVHKHSGSQSPSPPSSPTPMSRDTRAETKQAQR